MPYTKLKHRIKYSSLDRFQAVLRIRQCPADDDAHSIVEITLFYLLFQRKSNYFVNFEYTCLFIFMIHLYAPELLYHMTSGGASAALSASLIYFTT